VKETSEHSEIVSPLLVSTLRGLGWVVGKVIWPIRYHRRDRIPLADDRGLVIVSNHQTYFDPYWIGLPVYRDLRFMAWDEAFDWTLIGPLIRRLGAFPVNLERGSVSSMKESLRVLRSGAALVVFPEGSRTFADGNLQEFKPGAARLALRARVPVLPVTIRGGNRIWPRGSWLPRPGRVEIFYHDIIETDDILPGADERERAEALSDLLRDIIASEL